jgi:DEAD/DEAH box helicase domain-containing protein
MLDEIVVDVEIQKCIGQDGLTWDDTDKLGVAVAVVYEYRSDRFRIFGPDDVDALRKRLVDAERITGFNTWSFDFPVIFGLPRSQRVESLRSKSNDLLRRIWQGMGINPDAPGPKGFGGCKLDDVVCNTLGHGLRKIGNGADAPKWYQAGQIHKVINYCCDDVALERDLGRFMDLHGYAITRDGERILV